MAMRLLLSIAIVCSWYCLGVSARSNSSKEHKLLNELFNQYNKRVRPVKNESLPVEVEFGVRLTKLMGVDSKSQEMTVNVLVYQVWTNPFLKWNSANMGGLKRIVVDPSEIWVPDTGLINNADESSALAGGKDKFKTGVVVSSNGVCSWKSPATFKSDCEISVRNWPFDTQTCKMIFSSYVYSNDELTIKLLKQSKNKADSYATNGDWKVNEILLKKLVQKELNFGNYDRIVAELILYRRPQYFVLNLIVPSVVLCLLTLISFAIPSESGERIGFITTLLLAMTVYLLLIADVLPETSKEIPVIGLLFVITITESALILLFTIVILRCYHGTGEPYGWLQRLYCGCCPWQKNTPKSRAKPQKNAISNGAVNHGISDTPLDIPGAFSQFESKEFDHPTWQDIAIFVNKIFFILSLIIVVSAFLAVYFLV